MVPVVLKSIGGLVALAGAAAAGVGISHVYSGSPVAENLNLASHRNGASRNRDDKRALSFDESTEKDKNEWKSKLSQFKSELEKNKKELGVSDIEEGESDDDIIKKLKKHCFGIKERNSRAFIKWCMVNKSKVFSAQS